MLDNLFESYVKVAHSKATSLEIENRLKFESYVKVAHSKASMITP